MTTMSLATSPHVIRFGDIKPVNDAILVIIRSTKTRYLSAPPVVFRLPLIPNSCCCLVTAWYNYAANVTVPQDFPALVLPTGLPLTASTLLRALKLVSYAIFQADKNFTLHSLHRGAAKACQNGGLSLEHIMSAGMWHSGAVNTYQQAINISSAPAALAHLLDERS